MKVVEYSAEYGVAWDAFIAKAKNGHFLFYRKYMDYHSDRFVDRSLLFFDSKDRLIAVLPANISGSTLYSHQGLTFGGFIVSHKVKAEIMLNIFSSLMGYLNSTQLKKLVYKSMPYIYVDSPAQEDLYALFVCGGRVAKRSVSSAIERGTAFKYSKGRKWTVNKAKKENIELCEEEEFTEFWRLLSGVLESQHKAEPVHALNEIKYLHDCFPENIKLFVAKRGGKVIAGTVVYETSLVAHTQYLANSEEGRSVGALDLLIDHLIKGVYPNKKFFDFGVSTEEGGNVLNKGLIGQKEGFGATAIVQDIYELDIK